MVKIPKALRGVLERTPDTLHGALRFRGTRVPIEVFLDTIASGWSVERTLSSFPTIPRDAALAVLAWQNEQARKGMGLELVRK